MLKSIGLIGDVHAEDARLQSALDFLASRPLDKVLCVGDIADGRGDLQRCVELLRAHKVLCVRGNHDDWFLNQQARDLPNAQLLEALDQSGRDWMRELPLTQEFETVSGRLLLCHGVGTNYMANLRP